MECVQIKEHRLTADLKKCCENPNRIEKWLHVLHHNLTFFIPFYECLKACYMYHCIPQLNLVKPLVPLISTSMPIIKPISCWPPSMVYRLYHRDTSSGQSLLQ